MVKAGWNCLYVIYFHLKSAPDQADDICTHARGRVTEIEGTVNNQGEEMGEPKPLI